MDTYADDLAQLCERLELKDAIHVGHSTGGGEVARYIGRHGTRRVAKVVLIGAVTPGLLQGPGNPGGLPLAVFDGLRQQLRTDRAQTAHEFAVPFYGANREGAKVSQGLLDSFWRQVMLAGLNAVHDCVKAFSETDFTKDLARIDVPTLFLHGDDDQIVPIDATARRAVTMIPRAELKVYRGAPHGLCSTHKDQVNTDLLAFVRG